MESKGLSNENLEVVSTSNNNLTPSINYFGDKARFVKLTKNPGIDRYKYSGYGIGFDGHGFFSQSSVVEQEKM